MAFFRFIYEMNYFLQYVSLTLESILICLWYGFPREERFLAVLVGHFELVNNQIAMYSTSSQSKMNVIKIKQSIKHFFLMYHFQVGLQCPTGVVHLVCSEFPTIYKPFSTLFGNIRIETILESLKNYFFVKRISVHLTLKSSKDWNKWNRRTFFFLFLFFANFMNEFT